MKKNELPNSAEPGDRCPGRVIAGTAMIIDFQEAVAARTRQGGGRKARPVGDPDPLQAGIGSLQHQVDLLSVHLGLLQCRFELISFSIQETADFCADCHDAMRMTDIGAMERVRDGLRARLEERNSSRRIPEDFRPDVPPA